MSVFNAENTLPSVIDSVIKQSFTDYEFLIINDGSSDNSQNILEVYAAKEPRIRLFTQDNMGLTPSLNKGLRLAKGEFIARQDADDLSKENRLAVQVALLENCATVHLVGSNSEDHYDDLGKTYDWGHFSETQLEKLVFKRTPFPHSSVMMRTSIALELGGYDESYETAQDAELWMRFARRGRILMSPEKLIERHIHSQSISTKKRYKQWRDGFSARTKLAPGGVVTALNTLMRQVLIEIAPKSLIMRAREIKNLKILK